MILMVLRGNFWRFVVFLQQMFYSKYRNQSSSNKPIAWNTKEGKLEQIDAGLADI